jgi:hypothetical protein
VVKYINFCIEYIYMLNNIKTTLIFTVLSRSTDFFFCYFLINIISRAL